MRNTWSWKGKYEDTLEDSAPDPLYLLRTSIYSSPSCCGRRPVWWPVYNQSCNTFYCRWKLAFLNFDNDLLWIFAKWAFKQVLSMFNVEVAKFRTLEIQAWLIRGFYLEVKITKMEVSDSEFGTMCAPWGPIPFHSHFSRVSIKATCQNKCVGAFSWYCICIHHYIIIKIEELYWKCLEWSSYFSKAPSKLVPNRAPHIHGPPEKHQK